MITESEIKLMAILDNIPDMAWFKDKNSCFVHVNEAFAKVCGMSQIDIIGKKDSDIWPADLAQKYMSDDSNVIKSRERKVFEEMIEDKVNGRNWIETIKTPIYNEKGEIIGTTGIARNISTRKLIEQQILNAIIVTEEKEHKRIAEDLHDFFGPLLSGIMLYVEEIAPDKEINNEKKKLKKYLKSIISDAIKTVRDISNNLMPNMLYDWGLIDAINNFCQKINVKNKLSITVTDNIKNKRFESIIEIMAYRIIIELINNTIKHANAKKIIISFTEINNFLLLRYIDNGKGFNIDEIHLSNGMGLNNIKNRLKSINGKIFINSIKNEGSKIDIEIPLKV